MAIGVVTLLYVYQLVVGVILVVDCLFGIVFFCDDVVLLADVASGIVLILYAISIGLFLLYELIDIVVAVFHIIAQCFDFFGQVISLVINEKNLTKKLYNQLAINYFNRISIIDKY
ncbi:hypothetical protein GA0061082_10985 [Snodgrassella sp. R-53583]|nr:hypothetical protein GA0061082_10985 [Snodgrassella sp. R-53583]